MRNKQIFNVLFALWAMFAGCLFTAGCSKDDDTPLGDGTERPINGNDDESDSGDDSPNGDGEDGNDNTDEGDGGNADNEPADANRGPVAERFVGSGTQADPYIISSAAELRKLSDDVSKGMTFRDEYFKMANDIVINTNVLTADGKLNGDGSGFEQWIPIGNEDTPFCGTFDGNGHSIYGIYINDESGNNSGLGLFSWCAGTITRLDLKDSYLKGRGRIGGFVANACAIRDDKNKWYELNISRCRNYATIDGLSSYACGLVGRANDIGTFRIDRCANYGTITSDGQVAGIAGYMRHTKITNCYNKGNLKGAGAAGIVEIVYKYASSGVYNCFNAGTVTSTDLTATGGICGVVNFSASVSNCVNYGEVWMPEEKGDAIVGAVGENGKVSYSYYLETTGSDTRGRSMTANQMKNSSFLSTLNENAADLGSDFDKWVIGSDGFPVLEWSEE